MSGRRRTGVVGSALVAVVVAGSACGGSPTSGGRAPLRGPSAAQIARSTHVEVGGRQVAVPRERPGEAIAAAVDDGQQVVLSARGPLPARLYATPGEAVTWTNLTDEPQRVVFDHFALRSPSIPPGGTFSWTSPASESVAYHTPSGLHGVVVVNPRGL